MPAGLEMVATTRPYYRSAFVFVSRADRHLELHSLDDPRLRELRLGVQMIGDDGANAPPAHALARRGIIDNVAGFPVYAAGGEQSPHRGIIEAVANGDIDAALVWGPVAGPLARLQPVPLLLAEVQPRIDGPTLPMMFDISMGPAPRGRGTQARSRGGAEAAAEIDAILAEARVPRLDLTRPAASVR